MNLEIIRAKNNTYCVDLGGTCTGIYMLKDNKVVFIDSGRIASPEIFQWLDSSNLTVAAVIHTHLHVDHIANSNELYEKYKPRMIASPLEPLVSTYVKEGDIQYKIETNPINGTVKIQGEVFRIQATPGHTAGHQMVITPDNVGFPGDAMVSENFLSRMKFPYMQDVRLSIKSMEQIAKASLDMCVCAHNGVVEKENLENVIKLNIDKELELYQVLVDTLKDCGPLDCETLKEKYMVNAGVFNGETRQYEYMQESATRRIEELIEDGVLVRVGQKIKWHPQPESNRQ